jgi:tetratricopeptide (TPR) repeat protein
VHRLALATVLLVAAPAFGQSKSGKLFDEGRALAKQGKYDAACEKFEQSLALDRAPGTELNYGDCLEHLGQVRKAWLQYKSAARDFGSDRERVKFARSRAREVEKQLVQVVLKVADPGLDGLEVSIGSTIVSPKDTIEELLEPGDVEITAKAPGHKPFEARASGDAGASVTVEVPADLGDSTAKAPTITDARHRDNTDEVARPGRMVRDPGRVKIAWITGGVGIVALAVAGGFAYSAKSTYDSAFDGEFGRGYCVKKMGSPVCPDAAVGTIGQSRIDTAGTRADIATGLVIGGVVLVGAAAVIYFTAPRKTDTEISLVPSASPSGIGLAFSGRF